MKPSLRQMTLRIAMAVGLGLVTAACGGGLRSFPLRSAMWEDPDRQPFAPAPEEREVPYFWDAMDHMVFRRASEVWTLELARPSVNVNALDEVPNSSWFRNRIGRGHMTPEEVAAGACGEGPLDAPGPWTVIGGKPSGASPGFIIEDANGQRYLLKTDREGQPEQSTAADAIVAAVYHAAGYHVPCNRVVHFDPSILVLGPDAQARRSNGSRRPMTEEDLRTVAEAAVPGPDGRRRVLLSRFVDGSPVGPWDYVGTWDEDANDVVPHELRRELRGSYVLDAWVDHWDARQQNTLATWIETGGGGGYVRHYLLDFGECLGLVEGNYRRGPRFGHSAWLDVGDITVDILALGILQRAWDHRTPHPVLGYYEATHFDPDDWTPQYWNGALDRRTEADSAWMARILARFQDSHVRAVVERGHYSDPEVARRLETILQRRRDILLERYLTRLSPLADPAIESTPDGRARVCLTDLALTSGIRELETRLYRARLQRGPEATPLDTVGPSDGRVCVDLPHVQGQGRAEDYLVLDVVASTRGAETTGPARLHFYVTGPDRVRLVGLERPASDDVAGR